MEKLAELFEHLPMVVFWVKDLEGNFIRCNRRFEEMHGLEPGGALGKNDYDLHTQEMAARYRAEDAKVAELGKTLSNQVWMVLDGKGVLHWWVSTKAPVSDYQGKTIGVAGAMYMIADAAGMMRPYDRLEGALRLMHEHYGKRLQVEEIAKASHLSVSQFNRIFREIMGQSVKEYLITLRLEMAKGLLLQADLSLGEIAVEVGFYDGSEFGKRFKSQEGITPRQYRQKWIEGIGQGGIK